MSTISLKQIILGFVWCYQIMELVQENLLLEMQILILNEGKLHTAATPGSASRWHHVRPCQNTHPSHSHQSCHCLLGIKQGLENLNAPWEISVSHLCAAKQWMGVEAEELGLLTAARDSFTIQHPEPQTTAYAAWQEDAQRQLLSSPSILALEYFSELESCLYKPWVYSFLVINLTMAYWGYCFPLVAHLSDSEVWNNAFKKLRNISQDIIFGSSQNIQPVH